jgi:hypothetical protein
MVEVKGGLLGEILLFVSLNETVTPAGIFEAERFTFPFPDGSETVTTMLSKLSCLIEIALDERTRVKLNAVFPLPPPPLPGQLGHSSHLSGFANDSEPKGIATAKSAINKPEMRITC